ncbi:hypothetical protein BZA77DRAFT_295618 [Pyronema omphalodes]|nr:hypothetical protein BZA77DRAFT_361552 [Pyronema omphalodes]KAI5813962.1 hypothetical protein BZA77DRAFT_295618 [Pyronema omphalodes]
MDQENANEKLPLLCAHLELLTARVALLDARHAELSALIDEVMDLQQYNSLQVTVVMSFLERLYRRVHAVNPLAEPIPEIFPEEARQGLNNTFAQNELLSEQIAQVARHQKMSQIAMNATQTQLREITSQLNVIQSRMKASPQQRTETSQPSPVIRRSPGPDRGRQVPSVRRDTLGENRHSTPACDSNIKQEPGLSGSLSPFPEFESYSNSNSAPPVLQNSIAGNPNRDLDSDARIKLESDLSPSQFSALGSEPYMDYNQPPSPDHELDVATNRSPSSEPDLPGQLPDGSIQSLETERNELPARNPTTLTSPPPSPAPSRKRKSSSDAASSSPRASKSPRLGTPTPSEIDWVSDTTGNAMHTNFDIDGDDWVPASSPPTHPNQELSNHTPSSPFSSSLESESYMGYNQSPSPGLQSDLVSSPPASPNLEWPHRTPSSPSSSLGSESYIDYNEPLSPNLSRCPSSSLESESYVEYNRSPYPGLESDPGSSELLPLEPEPPYQLIKRPSESA